MSSPASLDPIPTPALTRWREFLHTLLPSLVFVGALAASGVIWVNHVSAPTLVGEVMIHRANVTSTLPGRVARLQVDEFAAVKVGDLVAEVITTDPKILESTLAVIRAEVELLRVSSDPVLNKERNQMDYHRLRIEWLDQRTQLASARVQLRYAESYLERITRLFRDQSSPGISSKEEYEIALRDKDALEQEITGRETLVREIQAGMERLPFAPQGDATVDDPGTLTAAIRLEERKLELAEAELSPLRLTAPIEGIVSAVYRRSGENVVAGEPIVTIVSTNSDRIVSYVIPPAVEPLVGARVEVISRTGRRERAEGRVTHVASHMDAVAPTLFNPVNSGARGLGQQLLSSGNSLIEIGIPILVNVPAGLRLRPGELVDLRVLEARP